jgi:hypothetical protein
VLRLWPKEVQIGLFQDHCWLRMGRSGELRDYVPTAVDADGMLAQLALMLDDAVDLIAKNARVVLTISDAFAAVICIPWQPNLRGADELRRYAEICFEEQGRDVGSDWLIHAEYRTFRANGMAYAVPAVWVAALEKLVVERGLRLARVLPVSVAMYFVPKASSNGRSLSLLCEGQRISALACLKSGLTAFDAEPVTTAPGDALRRLLRRVKCEGAPIIDVAVWSSMGAVAPCLFDQLEIELPEVRIVALSREALLSS